MPRDRRHERRSAGGNQDFIVRAGFPAARGKRAPFGVEARHGLAPMKADGKLFRDLRQRPEREHTLIIERALCIIGGQHRVGRRKPNVGKDVDHAAFVPPPDGARGLIARAAESDDRVAGHVFTPLPVA